MTRKPGTVFQLLTISLCIGMLSCAGTAQQDTRPALVKSAEKSLELGVGNYLENNFSKAESHFTRALFLYRNIDNPEGIVSSCLNLAKTKLSSGQTDSALAYARQAKSIIQQENLALFNDRATLIFSTIAIENGNYTEAEQLVDELLETARNNGNDAIRTAALQNRTRIALHLNADDAVNWVQAYENALKNPAQNTDINQARLLRFKAAIDPNSSEDTLSGALELYRQAAHSPGIAATLSEWAAYDYSTGAYHDCADKLHRALYIRANMHDRKNSREVMRQLAAAYLQLDQAGKSGRASYWQQQLVNPSFSQWDSLVSEFDRYPGADQ